MRVIEINGAFGLDHLTLAERPERDPGPNEVAIEMRAASLNYRDLMTVLGTYNPKQRLPLVPCSDGVGVVVAIGASVDRVRVGDRVATVFAQRWLGGGATRERARSTLGGPLDGVLQERLILPADGVVLVPEHLSDVEAATLPCAAVTAWSAVAQDSDGRGVRAGETVLVQGSGGVSLFALQFAKLFGARVIATTSSPEKAERLRALGADDVIDYRETPVWGARVRELTGGQGVDRIVEIGGAGTLAQSLQAIRFGGTIALVGILAGNAAEIPLTSIFMQNVRVQGVLVGSRDHFEAMNRAISLHGLRPVVDSTYLWTEARAALEALVQGRHVGKIALAFC